jgi:hypothetical protein
MVLRGKNRDIVAARSQDAGKPDAIALKSTFRKKLDDSEGYSHRYSTGPISNGGCRHNVRGHPPWQARYSGDAATAGFQPVE